MYVPRLYSTPPAFVESEGPRGSLLPDLQIHCLQTDNNTHRSYQVWVTMEQILRHMVAMCLVVLHFGLVCSSHTALSPSPHNPPSPAPATLHSPRSAQAPVPGPTSGAIGSPSPAPSSQELGVPVSPPAPASIPIQTMGGSPFSYPAPAPAPPAAAVADSASQEKDGTGGKDTESSSGLSGGQKAGIAVGVLFGVAAVGTGGIIYKKRQENIRRSQYGFAARREQL